MNYKTWLKRTGKGVIPLTPAGVKARKTARKNGKTPKSAEVIAFKVDNFQRSKKAKILRKKRKR